MPSGPVRKIVGGSAREFTFTAGFSMDSSSCFMYAYNAASGNGTSVASAMATSSGEGKFFARVTLPTSPGSYYARWGIIHGTLADGSDAPWYKTQLFEIVLEGEDE